MILSLSQAITTRPQVVMIPSSSLSGSAASLVDTGGSPINWVSADQVHHGCTLGLHWHDKQNPGSRPEVSDPRSGYEIGYRKIYSDPRQRAYENVCETKVLNQHFCRFLPTTVQNPTLGMQIWQYPKLPIRSCDGRSGCNLSGIGRTIQMIQSYFKAVRQFVPLRRD